MATRLTYTNFPKTSGTPTKKSKAEAEEITKEQFPHYYYGVPSGFIEVLTSYQKKRKNIRTATQEEYKIEEESVKDMCKRNMDALRNIDPVFFPINIPHYKDGDDAQDIVAHIKCAASRRYSVPNLPTIAVTDDGYAFPAYETWQTSQAYSANRVINSNDFPTEDEMVREMNTILMNMLLSLPPKAVHLSFVDMSCSGLGSQFTSKLNKSICRELITSPEAFRDYLKELKERQINIIQNYGELTKYNEENKRFLFPYEVVILLNYSEGYESFEQDLIPLFRNGYKGGIYFLVLNVKTPAEDRDTILKYEYTAIRPKGNICKHLPFVEITPIWDNDVLRKAAFDYLNKACEEQRRKTEEEEQARLETEHEYGEKRMQEEMKALASSEIEALMSSPYTDECANLVVPIGKSEEGVANFILDDINHVHAFILGKTGSGKSVLMHDIISSLILKYAPEDLQLYLMDFKTGGVEFNRYRDMKHSKALLVDNSDMQITLEILHSIKAQMRERGEKFRERGKTLISEYNRAYPQDRLPSIVLIVDECHVMFPKQTNDKKHIFNEISDILTEIVKEGRSQGVHIVFATQTLKSTEIPDDLLSQFTDKYILKCDESDYRKIVGYNVSSSPKFSRKGQVYYYHDQSHQFFSFYHPDDQLRYIIQQAIYKAGDHSSNGQFYFSGAQMFQINDSTIERLKKNVTVAGGLSISLTQDPITITLKKDRKENILLFGSNDQEQVNRTTMNLLITLAFSSKQEMDICVIDCLNDDEAKYKDVINVMKEKKLCRIIGEQERGIFFEQMVDDISEGKTSPTAIFVIGQEKFREIEDNEVLKKVEQSHNQETSDYVPKVRYSHENAVNTYKEALQLVLEQGPEHGIHTILQLDDPQNFMFMPNACGKDIFTVFRHLIILRSGGRTPYALVDDKLDLKLSDDNRRLRAYYYSNDRKGYYTLFSPFEMPTKGTITQLFKQ